MADPISAASLALSITEKTTVALNALRERAQRSKDVDIKEQINALYDNVLQLKELLSRLLDENKSLKAELAAKQTPEQKSDKLATRITTFLVRKARFASLAMTTRENWYSYHRRRIGIMVFAGSVGFATIISTRRRWTFLLATSARAAFVIDLGTLLLAGVWR